jgi:L-ascorbate metabolism protein UlaG (beta-lactamase superfamily)
MTPLGDERQRREHQILERIKELDLAHRNRLNATGASQVLSLRYLRRVLGHLFSTPRPAAAAPLPPPPAGAITVAPVGHGTVHIVSPAARVLVDPLLTNFLYGLRRAVQVPLPAEDRDRITCILITHGHRDHLHPASLRTLPKSALVVAPEGFDAKLSRLGFPQVVTLAPEESCHHGDLTITAVPARHDSGDSSGAAANGYILQAPEVAVYAAGDTGYFSGFADIGRRFRPDLALLPIGGYSPYPLRATHMSPLDAVYAWEDLQARVLVPVAYGVFPLGYEPLDEPLRWLRAACDARGFSERLAALAPGEPLTLKRAAAGHDVSPASKAAKGD